MNLNSESKYFPVVPPVIDGLPAFDQTPGVTIHQQWYGMVVQGLAAAAGDKIRITQDHAKIMAAEGLLIANAMMEAYNAISVRHVPGSAQTAVYNEQKSAPYH